MFVIAGVTGHVGGVAARALLAKGQQVKVIVRDAKKGEHWSKQGAEIAVGELGDQKFLTSALSGASGFFTLLPPNFAAPDFYAFQRQLSDTIAAAVKASGVPHVVILSSVGADLSSGNGPIKGLHDLENKVRATGATVTAIRACYFQENAGNMLTAVKQQGVFPNFSTTADYPYPMVASRDVGAQVAQSLLEKPGKSEVVDLQGPSYSVRQMIDTWSKLLGKPINIVNIPPEGHVPAMVQAGIPKHVAEVFAEMYAGFATGKIQPKGDRLVQAKTPIEETLKTLV